MDILGGLRHLLGLDGGAQKAQPHQQAKPTPYTSYDPTGQGIYKAIPAQQTEQPQQVNGYTPLPGYYDAAVKYNDAFNRGDYNSPDIIGQDPANFGYPADEAAPAQPKFQQPQYKTLKLTDILNRY